MTIEQMTEYFVMKSMVEVAKPLSQRRLDIMLFMAQAHSLAKRNTPITDATFFASSCGPSTWQAEHHYRYLKRRDREEAIAFRKKVGLILRGKKPADVFKITSEEASILEDVYSEYIEAGIMDTENKLKAPGTPWYRFYRQNRAEQIPVSVIKDYYSRPEQKIKSIEEKDAIREAAMLEAALIVQNQRSVRDVAKWFIRKAMEENKPLGVYKLMLMCYYAQGQAFKETGHELFWEPIWKRECGPYITVLHQLYRNKLTNDLDPTKVVKIPSLAQRELAGREIPISLDGIYKKYIDIPTMIVSAQAIDEIPFAVPNDSVLYPQMMRVEFIERGENHVY